MPRAHKATLPVVVGWWILRGIARQLGFNIRTQRRGAKVTFKDWMRRKWKRVPRPIRVALFVVGVTARASYRVARKADKIAIAGTKYGWEEGRIRHEENLRLVEARKDFSKGSTYYSDLKEQIKRDRQERLAEDLAHAQDKKLSEPLKPRMRWPEPTVVVASAKQGRSAASTPQYQKPDGGDYQISYGDQTITGYSKEGAERFAAWAKWRYNGAEVTVSQTGSTPQPGQAATNGAANGHASAKPSTSGKTNNGGTKVATATANADVTSVPELRDIYENHGPVITNLQDQLQAQAETSREAASAFDAVESNLSSEEFDSATISETSAVKDAYLQFAASLEKAAADADALEGAIACASKGLGRHKAMEEAVANSGHTAKSTAAYAAR